VSVIILAAYYFTKMMKIKTKGATVHQNPSAYFVIYLNSFIYVIKILSGTHKTCHWFPLIELLSDCLFIFWVSSGKGFLSTFKVCEKCQLLSIVENWTNLFYLERKKWIKIAINKWLFVRFSCNKKHQNTIRVTRKKGKRPGLSN